MRVVVLLWIGVVLLLCIAGATTTGSTGSSTTTAEETSQQQSQQQQRVYYFEYGETVMGSATTGTSLTSKVIAKGAGTPQKQLQPSKEKSKKDKSQGKGSSKLTVNLPPKLSVQPTSLDFKESPSCIATGQNVELINLSEEEIEILSINSESANFHISSVKSTIPPKSNLTIAIIYLPRVLGPTEESLMIQTSVGSFLYQMRGVGVYNPYRVSPFLGIKLPKGGIYESHLDVYNSHDDQLQISEMLASGGFIKLVPSKQSLPIEIGAYEQKRVAKIRFGPADPATYLQYIHLHTNHLGIVIPVEVQVVQEGVHVLPELVDFDTIVIPNDVYRTVNAPFSILNANTYPVTILDVKSSSASNLGLFCNLTTLYLPPSTEVIVGQLSYTPYTLGEFSGKISVITNDTKSPNVDISYKGNVVAGLLDYNYGNTTYPVIKKENSSGYTTNNKRICLTNKFSSPIKVYSATIKHPSFRIEFAKSIPTIIGTQQTWCGFWIHYFHKDINGSSYLPAKNSMFYVDVLTNMSVISIPVTTYDALLRYNSTIVAAPDNDYKFSFANQSIMLDFGTIGANEIRSKKIGFTNSNPIPIPIYSVKSTMNQVVVKAQQIQILSPHGSTVQFPVNSKPKKKLLTSYDTSIEEPILVLEPYHSIILKVEIACVAEEEASGDIYIKSAYESLNIKVKYRSIHGTLEFLQSNLAFESAGYPGFVQSLPLILKSTFRKQIDIWHLKTSDPRFIPMISNTVVPPNSDTEIGYVIFDPSQAPIEENYMTDLKVLSPPMDPLNKDDLQALKRRELLWHKIVSSKRDQINSVITVETNLGTDIQIDVSGRLTKPSILSMTSVDFGLIQFGTAVEQDIEVYNPTSNYIYVQVLPLYSPPSTPSPFSLVESVVNGLLLKPNSTAVVARVKFSPFGPNTIHKSSLFFKNNLTVVDALPLFGQGGSGHLVFLPALESEAEGEQALIKLQVEAEQLKQCKRSGFPENGGSGTNSIIIISKSLSLANTGNLPITVHSFYINDKKCEGYGVSISDCEEILLYPNEHRNITLFYQPDFTTAQVFLQLKLQTSQGYLNFNVKISLPYEYIPMCSHAQPQIQFESLLQMILIGVLSIIVVVLVGTAMREYQINSEKYLNSIAALSASELFSEDVTISSDETLKVDPDTLPSIYYFNLLMKLVNSWRAQATVESLPDLPKEEVLPGPTIDVVEKAAVSDSPPPKTNPPVTPEVQGAPPGKKRSSSLTSTSSVSLLPTSLGTANPPKEEKKKRKENLANNKQASDASKKKEKVSNVSPPETPVLVAVIADSTNPTTGPVVAAPKDQNTIVQDSGSTPQVPSVVPASSDSKPNGKEVALPQKGPTVKPSKQPVAKERPSKSSFEAAKKEKAPRAKKDNQQSDSKSSRHLGHKSRSFEDAKSLSELAANGESSSHVNPIRDVGLAPQREIDQGRLSVTPTSYYQAPVPLPSPPRVPETFSTPLFSGFDMDNGFDLLKDDGPMDTLLPSKEEDFTQNIGVTWLNSSSDAHEVAPPPKRSSSSNTVGVIGSGKGKPKYEPIATPYQSSALSFSAPHLPLPLRSFNSAPASSFYNGGLTSTSLFSNPLPSPGSLFATALPPSNGSYFSGAPANAPPAPTAPTQPQQSTYQLFEL